VNNEKLFDAMVKAAFEEAAEQEMAALPGNEELNEMYPPSEAFDKRIMAIIAREEKAYSDRYKNGPKRSRIIKTFARVAASIAVLFTVSTLALMSIEPSRVFVLTTLMNMHMQYDQPQPLAAAEFMPFSDEELPMIQRNWGMDLDIDVDMDTDIDFDIGMAHRQFSVIDINGQEVFLYAAEDSHEQYKRYIVRWSRGGIDFHISADPSDTNIDELLTLVESMITESE